MLALSFGVHSHAGPVVRCRRADILAARIEWSRIAQTGSSDLHNAGDATKRFKTKPSRIRQEVHGQQAGREKNRSTRVAQTGPPDMHDAGGATKRSEKKLRGIPAQVHGRQTGRETGSRSVISTPAS